MGRQSELVYGAIERFLKISLTHSLVGEAAAIGDGENSTIAVGDLVHLVKRARVRITGEDVTIKGHAELVSIEWCRLEAVYIIPMHLAKWTLRTSLRNRHSALKNDLSISWNVQVIRLTLDHVNRVASHSANIPSLSTAVRQWHARGHDSSRGNTEAQSPGHVLANGLPLLLHLPDVLRGDHQPRQMGFVINHGARNRLVGPVSFR